MGLAKKRLYMIQACNRQDGLTALPYSIGVLAAYALNDARIRDKYELCDIIGEKFDWDAYPNKIKHPDIVAFSCYIWNFEYSKALAKVIKKRFPQCVIIFGGHSIPIYNSNFLNDHSYVDYIIHGEGEIPFAELLLHLCGLIKIKNVNNISFRNGEKIEYRYDPECIVQDYPSPYLTGIFERFYNFSNGKYTATLETNRGCPFSCAYCDWGLNSTKLRKMELKKVLDEIEWMGQHHIFTCFGADSNFGIFDRDLEIARKLASVKKKYGFPRKFSVSYSKKSDDRVLEISTILNKCHAHAGATLSFQSLNPATLSAIGRKNLSLNHFNNLITEYNKRNFTTYSELILGLPMETYDSFVDGLCTLVEQGQYRYINVYDFILLINSELGRTENIKKYGLKTIKIPQRTYYCLATDNDGFVKEELDIVIETNSMSRSDWVHCRMFASILKGFHSYGILMYIATYLQKKSIISYRTFYEKLFDWIFCEENRSIFSPYIEMENWLLRIVHGEKTGISSGNLYKGFWIPAEEIAFLKQKEKMEDTYNKLCEFLKFYHVEDCWDELIRFQKTVMSLIYSDEKTESQFEYDFVGYFNSILTNKQAELSKKTITLNSANLHELLYLPKKIYLSQT